MANTKSAAKRQRQNVKRRLVNRIRKTRLKNSEKRLNESLKAGDKEAVNALLAKCYAEFDKAAKVGTIHANKASRKKQRLAQRVNKSLA